MASRRQAGSRLIAASGPCRSSCALRAAEQLRSNPRDKPMTIEIPEGFAEASAQLRGEGDPDPWCVTWGVGLTGFEGEMREAAGISSAAFSNNLLGVINNTVTFEQLTFRIGQASGPPLLEIVSVMVDGGAGSAMLPQNAAALFDKTSSTPGRRGRGRMFLPGCLPEGQVTETGVLSDNLIIALNAAADGFKTY